MVKINKRRSINLIHDTHQQELYTCRSSQGHEESETESWVRWPLSLVGIKTHFQAKRLKIKNLIE